MIWIEFCAVLVIWLSLWSLIPRDEWWFRVADFPRLQILAIGIGAFVGFHINTLNGLYTVVYLLALLQQSLFS